MTASFKIYCIYLFTFIFFFFQYGEWHCLKKKKKKIVKGEIQGKNALDGATMVYL